MNKLRIVFAVAMICLIVSSVAVYAVFQFMIRQNLTIATSAGMRLYSPDKATGSEIINGADASVYWAWTGTQFTLSLEIENIGNTVLTTGLRTVPTPTGWSITILNNGTLPMGQTQKVTMIATPPSLLGGTTTGDFDIYIVG